jgi:hypothetical protein
LFSPEDRLCYGASASEAFFDLYRQARPIHLNELA